MPWQPSWALLFYLGRDFTPLRVMVSFADSTAVQTTISWPFLVLKPATVRGGQEAPYKGRGQLPLTLALRGLRQKDHRKFNVWTA